MSVHVVDLQVIKSRIRNDNLLNSNVIDHPSVKNRQESTKSCHGDRQQKAKIRPMANINQRPLLAIIAVV